MELYLNCDDNSITFNKQNYLLRAAERLGLPVKEYTGGSVDYLLNIEPYQFAKGNRWTGSWEIDLLVSTDNKTRHWDECNRVYLANRVKNYPLKGNRRILYQACDPYLHKRVGKPEFDFIHAGSIDGEPHEERRRLIKLLADKYTNKDYGKEHKPEEYVKLLGKAKVQFIRSMEMNGESEVAQRFFECLAIGPVLTNYAPDLDHLGLIEGEDYLVYRTDEELIAQMDKLLANKALRDRIAKSGRDKALLYHCYEHRLMTILEDIKWLH